MHIWVIPTLLLVLVFMWMWKFTSASIGERLHPRHASSLSGQERDGEQKDGGEGTGEAEVRLRGASVCVGRLIWVGGSASNWGVGGDVWEPYGNTLTFHVSPFSLSPCPSFPPFLSPSLTLDVCLSAVSMATRWLWCCCWGERSACVRERMREEGMFKWVSGRDADTTEVITNQRHFED